MIKDSLYYILGELISKSIPFLVLPIMTRLLGVNGVSELIYYTSVIAVLVVIFGLSQDGALSRYYFRYGARSVGLPMAFSYTFTTVVFLIFSIIGWIISDVIFVICTLTAYSTVIFTTQLAYQQCQRNSFKYFCLQLLHALISLLALYFIFKFISVSSEGRIISVALANFMCVLVAMYFFVGKRIKFKRDYFKKYFKVIATYVFSFGFPLLLHQFSILSKNHFDKIILVNYLNEEIFSNYAVAFQLSSALSVFLLALSKALMPYYFQQLKLNTLNKKKLNKILFYSILIFQVPGLLSYFAPSELYQILLGEDFLYVGTMVVPLLMGFGLVAPYLIMVNYLFFYGKTTLISISTVLSSVFYLILLFTFIFIDPKLIVYVLFFSNLMLVIYLYYFLQREWVYAA